MAFTVAGFYEDPVMGSSMIGMKGFLICEADHEAIAAMIGQAGVDALAREGFMLHITQKGSLPAAPFNALLNRETSLSQHTEFTHSFSAMAGFMLTLQNVFTGLLLAFVVIFLLAALAVLSHSISSAIQQDYRDMGILKALGITTSALRAVQALQVLLAAGGGMACGALLAMPTVSVNGMDMTANVITEPERFHILSGRTCQAADEVVLTEFVAADLGVSVDDTVTLAGTLGSGEYTVSGIYQCANDMGQNIGLSREGYVSLGEDTPQMWCTHYFLEAPSLQPQVMEALSAAFGGDVYLHENSWPGLSGILSAMGLLMAFLYTMVAVFVLVATLLTVEKLLRSERRDLAIYRALGFPARRLQVSFALRFCLVGFAGSLLGTALSAVLTDPLVALLLRAEGISNFSSQPGWIVVALPGAVVTGLFSLFALLAAGKLKRIPLSTIASQ